MAYLTPQVKGSLESGGWFDLESESYRGVRCVVHCADQGGSRLADSSGPSGRGAREEGAALGRPLADRLKATKVHHLKELRPGSRGRSEIRIIFAFDPGRSALLLLGGDEAGNGQRWYRRNIPIAEQLYLEYTTEDEE
jgi:hypothetical protein